MWPFRWWITHRTGDIWLAVAEAMAAGLPLVASDWSGLPRSGTRWHRWLPHPERMGSIGPPAFGPIGMAAVHRIQGFPAIAGALAQLVQLDLAAAEVALLTVLSQPSMARAMGAAAARRARDLFAPEIVMAAHEELFAELERQSPSRTG